MWNPAQGVVGAAVGILILIALALITVNIVLVSCEKWIMLSRSFPAGGLFGPIIFRVPVRHAAIVGNIKDGEPDLKYE
jgi:hypothetical protein